jgi:adenosylcobinamide-phosphate guanylyltransferase
MSTTERVDALLMCGGEGSRLRAAVGGTEKPLVDVGGEPMVERVLAALADRAAAAESPIDAVYAAVSPATPETAARLRADDRVVRLETPGEGYVADLSAALAAVGRPVLTVAADLPFFAAEHVDRAVAAADGDSLTVCVPVARRRTLGLSAETTMTHEGRQVAPSGLNVVADGGDRVVVWEDDRLACNVNRPADLETAREWADSA